MKARPTDVRHDIFSVLVERLHCIRCYVGVETDADQGLQTLQRWANAAANRKAIEVTRALGLFVCFNVLMFDPDTTLESIETNVRFIEWANDCPFNFGKVQLYAGTPILKRMQDEGRARGDWLRWSYALTDPGAERFYRLQHTLFEARNFGDRALANDIQALRFDLEVTRKFHPELLPPDWHALGTALSARLARGATIALLRLLSHVREGDPATDPELLAELGPVLRREEHEVRAAMEVLALRLQARVGRGTPLTIIGDRVATALQSGEPAAGVRA